MICAAIRAFLARVERRSNINAKLYIYSHYTDAPPGVKAIRMHKKHKKLNLPEIYSAEQYATFLLSSRMLSSGQIREKLKNKGYQKTDIETVVKNFESFKYLDDEQFAQIYFENLKKYKNFGYFGIKKKLIERKLRAELIEDVLGTLTISEEKKIAQRLLEKSAGSKTFEQKFRMLQSRGFRGEVIARVVKRSESIE